MTDIWENIPLDRNDEECLNCHQGWMTGYLGSRRIDENRKQVIHECKICQNKVVTIDEEYNKECPTCNEGWITFSKLQEINKEKENIRKELLNELSEFFDRSLNLKWHSDEVRDFLNDYK